MKTKPSSPECRVTEYLSEVNPLAPPVHTFSPCKTILATCMCVLATHAWEGAKKEIFTQTKGEDVRGAYVHVDAYSHQSKNRRWIGNRCHSNHSISRRIHEKSSTAPLRKSTRHCFHRYRLKFRQECSQGIMSLREKERQLKKGYWISRNHHLLSLAGRAQRSRRQDWLALGANETRWMAVHHIFHSRKRSAHPHSRLPNLCNRYDRWDRRWRSNCWIGRRSFERFDNNLPHPRS